MRMEREGDSVGSEGSEGEPASILVTSTSASSSFSFIVLDRRRQSNRKPNIVPHIPYQPHSLHVFIVTHSRLCHDNKG
jgi:hypothetical protein